MKAIIVAYDTHYGIGADNDLLWQRDLPADLRHFKRITDGHAVIMGWNTYQSIGRPLPNRQNIVISNREASIDGTIVVDSLDEAYGVVEQGRETFVIGGGSIYAHAILSVDVIYATEVDAYFPEATVFFPEMDLAVWKEIAREHHEFDSDNAYSFDFVEYHRR